MCHGNKPSRFDREANASRLSIGLILFTLAIGSLLITPLPAATPELIPLRYADATDVARALQGMLEPGASVQAYRQQLIVNASPDHLRELERVIERLDVAPRNLLISVRQPGQNQRQRSGINLSGALEKNNSNHSVAGPNGTVTQTRSTVVVRSRRLVGADELSQSVRALEGRDAFIRLGHQAPVAYQTVSRDRYGNPVTSHHYRDAASGFWANARVAGSRVMIDVRTRKDGAEQGSHAVQRVDTQVSGRLGQWIAIGQFGDQSEERRRDILSRQRTSSASNATVYLKVQLLD